MQKRKFTKKFHVSGEGRSVFITKINDEFAVIDTVNINRIYPDDRFSLFNGGIDKETDENNYPKVELRYSSWTGLTQEGSLSHDYPLVEVGTYRIDTKKKVKTNVEFVDKHGNKAYIYAPIKNQESIIKSNTWVVTIVPRDQIMDKYEAIVLQMGFYDLSEILQEIFKQDNYIAMLESKDYQLKFIDIPYFYHESIEIFHERNYSYIIANKRNTIATKVNLSSFIPFNHISLNERKKSWDIKYNDPDNTILQILGVKMCDDNYVVIGNYHEVIYYTNSYEKLRKYLNIQLHTTIIDGSFVNYEWIYINDKLIVQKHNETKHHIFTLSESQRLVYNENELINKAIVLIEKSTN